MRKKKFFTKKQRKACRSRSTKSVSAPARDDAVAELNGMKRANHAQRRIEKAIGFQSPGDSALQKLRKDRKKRLKTLRREINKTKRTARKAQRQRANQ